MSSEWIEKKKKKTREEKWLEKRATKIKKAIVLQDKGDGYGRQINGGESKTTERKYIRMLPVASSR